MDPKDRPSAEELLKDPRFSMKTEEELTNRGSFKLLDKIEAPRKRDFRIIKDRLPRNKFSMDKIGNHSACMSEKDRNVDK